MAAPTTAQLKFVQSLLQKKYRSEHGYFLVEGAKNLQELANSGWPVERYWISEGFLNDLPSARNWDPMPEIVPLATLERVSSLQNNHTGVAVVPMPDYGRFTRAEGEWVLALDQVRDPGNLGTIIRIADWYGIRKIVLSPDSVEPTNPKVVAASMGSFFRVKVYEKGLAAIFAEDPDVVLGAYMDGENLHNTRLPNTGGYLLMGSESHGISDALSGFVTQRLSIPRFGEAESLNVGVATAVILDAVRRG
jgi:TrmH family RNA methyltransferase